MFHVAQDISEFVSNFLSNAFFSNHTLLTDTQTFPTMNFLNSGSGEMESYLKARDIKVPRQRVCDTLWQVDLVGNVRRKSRVIKRRYLVIHSDNKSTTMIANFTACLPSNGIQLPLAYGQMEVVSSIIMIPSCNYFMGKSV